MNGIENRAGAPQFSRTTAPAKINLGLRIVGRRPDGYHELESVFLPLDLADDVSVEWCSAARRRVAIVVETTAGFPEADIPGDARNLAAQAAQAFLDRSGLDLDVKIRIVKRIPAAAGLGGGSSDAGAVLRLLASAHPDALGAGSVADLALTLGADVPFFLNPRPALVSGIGESSENVPNCPELSLLLVNPGIRLATDEVYRAADALEAAPSFRGTVPSRLREELERAIRDPAGGLGDLVSNDLEAAAVRLCPPVARLRERLVAAGATAVGLSGSGPTVYGIFASAEAARAGLARLAPEPPLWARTAIAAPGSRSRQIEDNL